jgi:hypothetical protein
MVAQFRSLTHSSSTRIVPRHISRTQWQIFEEKVTKLEMEPEDFLNHWDCTYYEIAKICKCSRNTVANWFSRSDKRPTDLHKRWLGTAHQLLLRSQ